MYGRQDCRAAMSLCPSHHAFQMDLTALQAAYLCTSSCVLFYLVMPFIQALPLVTEVLRWGDHIINTKSRTDKEVKLNANWNVNRLSDLKPALKNRQKG